MRIFLFFVYCVAVFRVFVANASDLNTTIFRRDAFKQTLPYEDEECRCFQSIRFGIVKLNDILFQGLLNSSTIFFLLYFHENAQAHIESKQKIILIFIFSALLESEAKRKWNVGITTTKSVQFFHFRQNCIQFINSIAISSRRQLRRFHFTSILRRARAFSEGFCSL